MVMCALPLCCCGPQQPPTPPPLQVSPFHASVLMHFQTRPEWPAAELAAIMAAHPALTLAPDGRILSANAALLERLGTSLEALRGRLFQLRLPQPREPFFSEESLQRGGKGRLREWYSSRYLRL